MFKAICGFRFNESKANEVVHGRKIELPFQAYELPVRPFVTCLASRRLLRFVVQLKIHEEEPISEKRAT